MKAWKISVLTIFLGLFINLRPVLAEAGDLDTSFGEEGKVVTSFGQYGAQANSVALQSDGKILAAGSASNGVDLDLAIARYNSDGSLDTSFGNEGRLWTSLGYGDDEIAAIAVQDDRYIVAAGFTVVEGGRDFVLVRMNPNGGFDSSFGEGGVVVTPIGNQDDEITAMTIDSEGRIVVCGYATGTAGNIVALARYGTGGDLDVTFGDQGITLVDIGDDALARSIDIDDDGRIVVGGSYFHAERTELMILRFQDNGGLDDRFGQRGVAVPADTEKPSDGFGVRLMEDGKILVAGSVGPKGDLDAALFRFDESGSPDASHGDNGVLITSAGDEDDMALALGVRGNIVGMSGYTTFNTKRDFLLVSVEEKRDEGANTALNLKTSRFVANRQYANVFDLNGSRALTSDEDGESVNSLFNTTSIGFTADVSYAVVMQQDGKAVSAGFSEQDGVTSFALARYVMHSARSDTAGSGGGGSASGSGTATVNWVRTKAATNVTRTGAFTGGAIYPSGQTVTQRGVVYGIAPDPTLPEGSGTNDGATPNQTCNENCAATSGACSSHGGVNCSKGPDSDGSVICNDGWRDSTVKYVCNTTASTAPAQTTTTAATGTNTASSVFNPTSRYSNYGSTVNGAGIGSFSAVLKNLRPGTVFYVRAYAKEGNGNIYYGDLHQFKTADSCFIATAAFGSLLHPYVSVLRNFRDQYLESNFLGRQFVSFYYRHSPPVADFIASRSLVRHAVQVALLPLIAMSWLILQIGFAGLFLLTSLIISPVLICRSYRKIESNF